MRELTSSWGAGFNCDMIRKEEVIMGQYRIELGQSEEGRQLEWGS